LISGLDHVAIPMPREGEERARGFYGHLLCLREVPKPATLASRGGAWFQMDDGRQIHLQAEREFTPLTRPHPAFRVTEIDTLARRLSDSGCVVTWDDALAPTRRFYIADPFGNRLEFLDHV
jgi:catechol 2,3-dioxygenase-like lactoylglutathione lyase family enzyme